LSDFCFLKISTNGVVPGDGGKLIVGWSEYLEERNIGITQVIEWMGQLVMGTRAALAALLALTAVLALTTAALFF